MNTPEMMSFDIELESKELFSHPEMVASLAKPGRKEIWVEFLQTGETPELDDADRDVMDMLIAFLNSYALLTAYDKYMENEVVNRYFEIMGQMQESEDQKVSDELNREMLNVVAELPEEFKDAVTQASEHGQEFLLQKMRAA